MFTYNCVVVVCYTDSDYESSAEYETFARKYDDILKSSVRQKSISAADESSSNLQITAQSGTLSYMQLWCEQPKVIEISLAMFSNIAWDCDCCSEK